LFPTYTDAIERLEELAARVCPDVNEPHKSPEAEKYDRMTLVDFTMSMDRRSRELLHGNLRCILGAEPSELSLLFVCYVLRTSNGYAAISDSHNQAQHGMKELLQSVAVASSFLNQI
jgi:hypothetical protein